MNSVILTNAGCNHIGTVFGRHKDHIGRVNPTRTTAVLNLGNTPATNSAFRIVSSRRRTHRVAGGHRRLRHRRNLHARGVLALSRINHHVTLNKFRRLGIVIGNSISNSVRTLDSSLVGLSARGVTIGIVRGTIKRVSRDSITLTTTSRTVVVNFRIHPSTATHGVTRRRNISVHLCSVVCSAVRRIGSTVRKVLTPRIGRRIATAIRIHRICRVDGINAITNTCIVSNGIRHSGGTHLVHSNVIIRANRVGTLGHFGSSIGRINAGFRYNVDLIGCGSLHRNSVVRACRRVRVGTGLWSLVRGKLSVLVTIILLIKVIGKTVNNFFQRIISLIKFFIKLLITFLFCNRINSGLIPCISNDLSITQTLTFILL